MRTRLPFAVLALLCTGLLAGCSTVEGLARSATGSQGGADQSLPCPTDPTAETGAASTSTPTPRPTATLDPTVAGELRDALQAVRVLPGIANVDETTTNAPDSTPDPSCPVRPVTTNHFATTVTVSTAPDATPEQAGAVAATMSEHLAWTGVTLVLTVPAAAEHIASSVEYDGTFDQRIPPTTSTSVAQGLATLAATPHVTGLDAVVPSTMRVDYGSLTIGVDTTDEATLAAVRTVIDGTAFAHTTLHGSFGNGAKP